MRMKEKNTTGNPCSHYEGKGKMHLLKKCLVCTLAVLLAAYGLVGCGGQTAAPATTAPVETETVVPTATTQPEEETVETVPETEATETAVPVEYQEVLDQAKKYVQFIPPYSYEGLISALEYDGYSHEAAVYAADNCGADWNELAVKSAQNFLSFGGGYSYEGLMGMLEFEKFTAEQITYAVDNCGADWNEQAVLYAKTYLNPSSLSRSELVEKLRAARFTEEQIEYAVAASGL